MKTRKRAVDIRRWIEGEYKKLEAAGLVEAIRADEPMFIVEPHYNKRGKLDKKRIDILCKPEFAAMLRVLATCVNTHLKNDPR